LSQSTILNHRILKNLEVVHRRKASSRHLQGREKKANSKAGFPNQAYKYSLKYTMNSMRIGRVHEGRDDGRHSCDAHEHDRHASESDQFTTFKPYRCRLEGRSSCFCFFPLNSNIFFKTINKDLEEVEMNN
jgi:hypothetical protein